MKLSEPSIRALTTVITGDKAEAPYRSGPDLIVFFNQFSVDKDEYGQGFPARWKYAEDKLQEFNDSQKMKSIILAALDPRHFLDSEFDLQAIIAKLNVFLDFDDLEVLPSGKKWKIVKKNNAQVTLESPHGESLELTHIFIQEQLEKCDSKLGVGDYDGAITNARSLVEAVLKGIEKDFDQFPPNYDGDILKLYKRVQKHLNLEVSKNNLPDSVKQILTGLSSIINGLASLRNSMSDSHAISYKPQEHHARLAVNAAKTVCHFLYDTQEYQSSRVQTAV